MTLFTLRPNLKKVVYESYVTTKRKKVFPKHCQQEGDDTDVVMLLCFISKDFRPKYHYNFCIK